MPGSHAKLSPSGAHRWMNCPGSVAACEGLESPDSVYSREGTFAHAIATEALTTDQDAGQFIGRTDGEFTVDVEMATHLQSYLDAVRGLHLLTRSAAPQMLLEAAVQLTDEIYGTTDCIVYDGPDLHVVDLKYGAGKFVPVEDNEQTLIYALAAMEGMGLPGHEIERVHMHIVQPRRRDADERAHRTQSLTREEMNQFRARLWPAADLAKKPGAPLVSGSWCAFCPARATCPQLRKDALAGAVEVFAAADSLAPAAPPAPGTLSTERLAEILAAGERIDSWLSAVRQHALERSRHEKIPGWKPVARLSNRKWIDETKATAVLTAAGVDPFEAPALVSPAQAEKRLGKAKSIVDPLTERVVTGALLVPESDRRPALTGGDVFTLNQ